eukprot:gnl/TRDRNA2_/TRDRNA2_164899_c0_seq2.p1 gnl/TRDRNA2_/TRDRNA2_164899_c0~~gnl/TRDRNA2_/TRDRNA2_164899_c0_seq2.p1  ORF type:complete len:217 (+),score=41.75 gnl/TRDRNA2_/TRDRNA2_164899_c0_seq2:64-714(+)
MTQVLQPPKNGDELGVDPSSTTLIFVDGTWPQAKKMVYNSIWLKQLPRVVINSTARSGFYFRKQPEKFCLSTIEAVAEALLVLEGARGPAIKEALGEPFKLMVNLTRNRSTFSLPEDQNPVVMREELPLFQADVALRGLPVADEELSDKRVMCIICFGERSVDSRELIVVKTLRATRDEARKETKKCGEGRNKGYRCYPTSIENVPAGAFFKSGVC